MAKYRASNLDLSARMAIVAEMMLPAGERGWGRVTQLAGEHGVSRTRLYQLKDKVRIMLAAALAPENPGPKMSSAELVVDEGMIKRAISLFPAWFKNLRS